MTLPVVCFDIDSCIADTRHRWDRLNKDNPDWLDYALASEQDTPANIDILREFSLSHNIIFVSSRPEAARNVTLRWLNKLNVPYLALVLDEEDMSIGDFKVKAIREISEIYDVWMHVDDRLEVQQAVERELGIPVMIISAYND